MLNLFHPPFETFRVSDFPPRSRFYHLTPIGVGTPYVESFSGYVARLAEKHSTTLYYLFSREVAPLINKPGTISHRVSFASFAKAVNGLGVIAADLVEVFERLTLRGDLKLTTMIPWAGMLSAKGLTREERAWCPLCYDQCVADGMELYDQLLWAIQTATACARHKRRLEFVCPQCSRRQLLLSHDLRPGFCGRCQCWLGRWIRSVAQSGESGRDNATEGELRLAEEIGKLLASVPELPPFDMAARLTANLRGHVDKMFMGRGRRSQLRLPADKLTIRCWLRGTQTPSLLLLLETCSALGISAVDLLRVEGDETSSTHGDNAAGEERVVCCRVVSDQLGAGAVAVDWRDEKSVARVERRLRASVEEDPPTSLTQVAKELHCSRSVLRKKFPELAAQVAEKATAFYRPSLSDERMAKVLRAALVENPPPSLQDVSQRLGAGASTTVLHKRFPEESREIIERYRELKKRRLDDEKLRKELRAALKRMPPPSMTKVVGELGVAKATLYSKFPELCNAISGRFAAYRRERDANSRAVAREEIRAICECAIGDGIYPSLALVKKHLSVPCQSEALSKIRREVLVELTFL